MNIVVEKQPKCVATLRVEIPADKVQGQRDRIVRGYASKARVPGFRPGKAPRAIIEKRFDKEIGENRVLLMVDISAGRVEEIQELVHRRHPEASDHGIEPSMPAFP